MDGKKVEEKVRSLYINKYIIKRNNWIHKSLCSYTSSACSIAEKSCVVSRKN